MNALNLIMITKKQFQVECLINIAIQNLLIWCFLIVSNYFTISLLCNLNNFCFKTKMLIIDVKSYQETNFYFEILIKLNNLCAAKFIYFKMCVYVL